MAEKKGGLGRGLGALFAQAEGASLAGDPGAASTATPTTTAPPVVSEVVGGARLRELPPSAIRPNPKQPRTYFDEGALAELVVSLREVGVLQPVVVRPAGRAEDGSEAFELIMGERRWRAAQEAGLAVIPAIVRETADEDLLRDALLENLHRHDLNALEEAAAYAQLLDEFGVTHDELATRIGRSRPHVSNTIRLLQLPAPVQRRVAAGVLSAGHARALLALDDALAQEELAARVVAEGLSVRAVEEIVKVGEGDARRPQRASRPRGDKPAEAINAELSLTDRLDTRVKVEIGKGKGTITIGFGDVDDLVRITAIINGTSEPL
ncbi:MAG TPA: ParB/RepB/Spo0J family partition protein [Mycobacteriales bacterium]|nr:ParB/RepB/Spo0J family partition protein [Mycobacteriales bacterium]